MMCASPDTFVKTGGAPVLITISSSVPKPIQEKKQITTGSLLATEEGLQKNKKP